MKERNVQPTHARVNGLLWMLSGGMLAMATVVGVQGWQMGDRWADWWAGLWQPATPKVDVRSLVVQQMRSASDLTTAVFTMQAVVPTEQDAALGGVVFGKTKLLYIAHGEVKAGVDLSQLTPDRVQVSDAGVHIQLPPAQVLDQKIDVARSRVYDYDRGWFGLGPDVAPELQQLAQAKALEQITAAACDQQVLQQAGDRAKQVVTQLLTTAGYATVTVTVPPPPACPVGAIATGAAPHP